MPLQLPPFVSFRTAIEKCLAKAIFDLQRGNMLGMPLSRPMPSVARGVSELRIRDRSGIYRAFYYTQSPRGILVFHAFANEFQGLHLQTLM